MARISALKKTIIMFKIGRGYSIPLTTMMLMIVLREDRLPMTFEIFIGQFYSIPTCLLRTLIRNAATLLRNANPETIKSGGLHVTCPICIISTNFQPHWLPARNFPRASLNNVWGYGIVHFHVRKIVYLLNYMPINRSIVLKIQKRGDK